MLALVWKRILLANAGAAPKDDFSSIPGPFSPPGPGPSSQHSRSRPGSGEEHRKLFSYKPAKGKRPIAQKKGRRKAGPTWKDCINMSLKQGTNLEAVLRVKN